MKNYFSLAFVVMFLCCFTPGNIKGQSLLNKIRIDQCDPFGNRDGREFDGNSIAALIEEERRLGLVLDARPFAINQSTGKLNFDGKTGRVSVVHMNPFLYEYKISVVQEELVSSAVTDFIDILLPPGLRSIGRAQTLAETRNATTVRGNLAEIEKRLNQITCADPQAPECIALASMGKVVTEIKNRLLDPEFVAIIGPPPSEVPRLTRQITEIRDPEADAYTTCTRARTMMDELEEFKPAEYVNKLNNRQKRIDELTTLVDDLLSLVKAYSEDSVLQDRHPRCGGFDCVGQFNSYAQTVQIIINRNQQALNEKLQIAQALQTMFDLTRQMRYKEGLFARTFPIIKKFELSEATVSITRTKIEPTDAGTTPPAGTEAARAARRSEQPAPAPPGNRFDNPVAGNGNHNEEAAIDNNDGKGDDSGGSSKPVKADINESIRIGRPRFLVSGGLVYSPLPRQTFVSTTGFSRDAQGNPIGDANKTIVGFDENSPRRLMPMVLLNSRLASFSPASIYFTLGVTAKHDRNLDVEYLLGPSVSMLNERAMFTFGAYAGKTSNLVPDVKVGDEIPESAGNAALFTKHYTWKPGFSFSYVFSNVTKASQEGSSKGMASTFAAAAADEFKDEIRIGSIPFNLAMGLAYTSLEDRVYDEVLGFARDRQGNLTNGQTLTRIVGLATSSNYRLVPLAMLHSRLLNFGRHSFYFTSGVSGKKDDDQIQLEYLLGGSVNVYQRKIFFTFGAFAGKQQVLGGDLFPGAKLAPSQNVTTETRYVWKPGFAFSYDISRITKISKR